ncbi:MAG: gliding motility-associated C-terminal domain-containing protein [Bacteroidetes bacterium]|nr:gliding motility-associated C-terminal domain-containing protein [Bacteroidota bacterium]
MPNEPEIKLSATAVIKVSKIAFSDEREFEICLGENKQLNVEASNIYRYTWTPNENINDLTISNPTVSPQKTTRYTAVGKLEFCVDSVDFNVKVNPIPIHNWASEDPICEGASKKLDPGVYPSYLWGNMDTTQTITVSNEDWYTVKLTNEFGCTSKDSTRVKWSILPKLDYGELDTLVCGSKQQRINLAFENGSASTNLISTNTTASVVDPNTLSPTISVDEFGTYSFQMEVTDQYQCEYLDTLNIEFHNQPEAKFFLDEDKCQGYSLDLNFIGSTIEPAVFTWFINDSVFKSEENLQEIIIPLGYGLRNRTVGLKVNEQGCIDSIKIPVTVIPKMNFWVEENPNGCTPLNVKFGNSNVEEIEKYSWDFGDGESALIEKPTHIFTNSGVADVAFDVNLTVVSVEDCENTGVLNNAVIVHPKPTIDFTFEEGVCYSENATVSYIGSGNENDTYYWDLSNFQMNEILQNPETSQGPLEFKRISEPTVQIGLKMISEFGCETDSISKIFSRKPIFNVESDKKEGCFPLGVEFKATTLDLVDEVNYSWNFGNENYGAGEIVSNEFLQDDKYYTVEIVAKSKLTGCADTSFLTDGIFVYPQPKAFFAANPPSIIISNPVILFENTSEKATFYEWNFDDNLAFSEEKSPEHRFEEMGFFNVKLSAFNDFGCVDTTIQQVSVAFDKLFPPTAFSPNATFEEDREFRIHSKGIINEGYRLLVYNRWGEVIFESESQEIGWDGKMKNDNFSPAGVYTWVIQFLDFRGEKYKQQGIVTLLF